MGPTGFFKKKSDTAEILTQALNGELVKLRSDLHYQKHMDHKLREIDARIQLLTHCIDALKAENPRDLLTNIQNNVNLSDNLVRRVIALVQKRIPEEGIEMRESPPLGNSTSTKNS